MRGEGEKPMDAGIQNGQSPDMPESKPKQSIAATLAGLNGLPPEARAHAGRVMTLAENLSNAPDIDSALHNLSNGGSVEIQIRKNPVETDLTPGQEASLSPAAE